MLKAIGASLENGSGDVTALSGRLAGSLRLRHGNNRVIFDILQDGRLDVQRVAHRRDDELPTAPQYNKTL